MTINFSLAKAIKEREEFLQKNPELLRYQNDLEAQFKVFGNDPSNNLNIIRHHIKSRMNDVEEIIGELKEWKSKIT